MRARARGGEGSPPQPVAAREACHRPSHTTTTTPLGAVRVEYVPDDEEDIAATALRLRERVGPSG